MRNRHVNVVQYFFEEVVSALAPVRVRVRHQNVTRRGSITVAEVEIIQWLEKTQPSTIGLSGFNDFFQKLNFFFHVQSIDKLKGLIFCNDVQIEKAHNFNQIVKGFLIQYFLEVLKNKLLVFNRSDSCKRNCFLRFLLGNTLFLVNCFRRFFFCRPLVFSLRNFLIVLINHLVWNSIDFQVLQVKASNELLSA